VFVTSAPTPSACKKNLPEVPGLSFFFIPPQGYLDARRLIGLFFLIWSELRYKARGKLKNGELGGFCVISTLKL
jgi:hypothetical protein